MRNLSVWALIWIWMLLTAALTTGHSAEAAPLILAEEGSANAFILAPASPSTLETFAAEQMARYLTSICGCTFEIVEEADALKTSYGQPVISIGRTALAKGLTMRGPAWKRNNREAFRIVRRGNALIICGNQKGDLCDNGTLWGVYTFLAMQGVGSYLPDPLGRIIPSKPTLTIDEIDFTDAPAFEMRGGDNTPANYLKRFRPGGDHEGEDTSWLMFGRGAAAGRVELYHVYQYVVTPEVRKEHPEWFEHTHNPRYGPQPSPGIDIGYGLPEAGICLTRPEIRNLFIEYFRKRFRENPDLYAATICPDDYHLGDRCECPECQRLMAMGGPPTFIDDCPRSSSDLHIDFVNAVAKGLEKEFPDRKLITYAYLDYMDPPTQTRVHPNVIIMIAPLRSPDELHPALDEIVRGWQRMGAKNLYWYGYVLTRPPIPHLMGEWFRNYKRLGIAGVYLEFTPGVGAFSALNRWLSSKLMWDPGADVGKLIDEFCMQLFGPEIGPLMRRFFVAWDVNPPFAQEDIPRLLSAAETMAGDPESVLGRRVRLFKLAYELWQSSYDLDEALKLNDIRKAHEIVKAGLEVAESLRREYPGWALNQNVAMLNRTGWCEYSASVLPALEALINSEIAGPGPETPAPGPVLCLTNNADVPNADRIDTGVTVPSLSGEEGNKLFDGKTEAGVGSGGPRWTIDLDLQKEYQIESVEVCTGMTTGESCLVRFQSVPIYIEIQVSNDGKDFKPVDRILPRTLRGFVHSGNLLVTARYVRLVTASLNYLHEVDEVRLWGRPKPE